MNVQQQPPNIVNDPLSSQLQNLDINSDIALHMTGSNVIPNHGRENTQRSNGNRSISDAGLYDNPYYQCFPAVGAQTAPARSENFYGFNYPYMFIPYDGSANNNIMPHPASLDNNLRSFIPISNAGSSFNPNPPFSDNSSSISTASSVTSDSITAQTPPVASSNEFGRHVLNPGITLPTPVPRSTYQGGLLMPRVPYILMSQSVTPPLQNSGTTPPRTTPSPNPHPLAVLSESPEKSHTNMAYDHSAESGHSNLAAFENPLRINIESNDNSAHSWHPRPTNASGMNYPYLSHVIRLSPNNESSGTFSVSPKASDQGMPTALQYPPMYWNQQSLPVLPFQPYPYPHPSYYQVPAVDVPNSLEMYVSKQKQMMNSVRYECVKTKLDIATCKEGIKDLEQQLKDSAALPKKEQLEKEISELRTECLCLSREVDLYSEEKAPLGEVSDDFYSCLNTGQQGPLLPDTKQGPLLPDTKQRPLLPDTKQASKKPPPRPPRPSKNKLKQLKKEVDDDVEEIELEEWLCTECTFRNHPLISSYCEMCNQPRNATDHVS